MDHMELMMLRMNELRPAIPFWARAEQMEIGTPRAELWKYADESVKTKSKSNAQRLSAALKRLRTLKEQDRK